jgi:pectate lyase
MLDVFLKRLLVIFMLTFSSTLVKSQPLAFPGAEGCGRFATGGRSGKVVFVSNLNDSGPGSLREALNNYDVPQTILFSVSGTIFLKSIIKVSSGNFTLAGQSALGDGICIAGAGLDIEADNVIIRYMRLRPGEIDSIETDALTIKRSHNVIVDHCSMSWSTDETCSCYDNYDFTLQWCIVSESLNKSVHHKGEHGYGGIWGGQNATFHHNLLSHHNSRNPRLHGSRYLKQPEKEKAELINNVVYNWKSKCIYGGEEGTYTITENYFKPGPATSKSSSKRILDPWEPFSTYYFNANYIEGNPMLSTDNKLSIDEEHPLPDRFLSDHRLAISNCKFTSATDAYSSVLEHAGASIVRDGVDKRIIDEVRNGKYNFGEKGIINSQTDVGGWPELKGASPLPDSDRDGMPDEWELRNKLNPNNPNDGSVIKEGNDYSNLEIYLNGIGNN